MSTLTLAPRTATVDVLGEDITREVPIPLEGAPASALLHAAGLAPRDVGWDLFIDGMRCASDVVIDPGTDVTLKYVPRTRGA